MLVPSFVFLRDGMRDPSVPAPFDAIQLRKQAARHKPRPLLDLKLVFSA
jgi:hypothetical protein